MNRIKFHSATVASALVVLDLAGTSTAQAVNGALLIVKLASITIGATDGHRRALIKTMTSAPIIKKNEMAPFHLILSPRYDQANTANTESVWPLG